MTEKPPDKTSSGEHPAVKFMRRKLDSIAENELEDMKKLNERLTRATTPVPKDPRRDGNSEPPIDVVNIEPDPFPPHEKE